MEYSDPIYADVDHQFVSVRIDGMDTIIPADMSVLQYREIKHGNSQTGLKPVPIARFKPTAEAYRIDKLVFVDRLIEAGLFDVALRVLKSSPAQYERWQASKSVDPENVEVRKLVKAIGGDAQTLLAR